MKYRDMNVHSLRMVILTVTKFLEMHRLLVWLISLIFTVLIIKEENIFSSLASKMEIKDQMNEKDSVQSCWFEEREKKSGFWEMSHYENRDLGPTGTWNKLFQSKGNVSKQIFFQFFQARIRMGKSLGSAF